MGFNPFRRQPTGRRRRAGDIAMVVVATAVIAALVLWAVFSTIPPW